jgi:hypothetical protein
MNCTTLPGPNQGLRDLPATFILSKDELSDAMLGKYEEFVAFHSNPITSSDRSGVLITLCNVRLTLS